LTEIPVASALASPRPRQMAPTDMDRG